MRVTAIIPARGGSKGIPRKNLQTIQGKNLIQIAVDNLRLSEEIMDVYVSSDSIEIKNTVFNADGFPKIHHRSKETSLDNSSTESVLLEFIEDAQVKDTDILVCVQCTNPFLDVSLLDEAIRKVKTGKYNSAVSLTSFTKFIWDNDKFPINYNLSDRKRRQEIIDDTFYVENGSFYVTLVKYLKEVGNRLPSPIYKAIQENPYTQFEIDEPMDLEIARTIYAHRGYL